MDETPNHSFKASVNLPAALTRGATMRPPSSAAAYTPSSAGASVGRSSAPANGGSQFHSFPRRTGACPKYLSAHLPPVRTNAEKLRDLRAEWKSDRRGSL